MNWQIGTRPTEAGCYWTVLLHEKQPDDGPAIQVAEMGIRCFGSRSATNTETGETVDLSSWVMDGEPQDGLVWQMETGSSAGEHVYAWAPLSETPFPELPAGTIPHYEVKE